MSHLSLVRERQPGKNETEHALAHHYSTYEVFLKKAKKQFEERYYGTFSANAKAEDFVRMRTLGTGSFGRVILVKHKQRGDKAYAMKMMEKAHVVKTKQVEHTHSEIRVMDAMRFDFLVYMEFFFTDNVYLYLVMPFMSGGEMFTHLRQMKRFEEHLAKFYGAQVILAFEYMHFIGLVYRDLKPENILCDKDGYIKITDYGFCKKIDDQRTYTLCGTPEYLAPEIIMSQGYNKSVDWWSFGILLFEMNAGYPPFYARDPMKIYEKIVHGKFTHAPHFSKSLKDLLTNIIQVDRSKRYGILKNGPRDIKGHEWFKGVEWEGLLQRKVRAPFKPKVSAIDDASNFDTYKEEPLRYTNTNEFAEEFAEIVVKY